VEYEVYLEIRVLELGMKARRREMAAAATPKGRAEKQVLAWWLHGRTTVTRRWIAE